MRFNTTKRRHRKFEPRVRVWKLKEERTCEEYYSMVRDKVEEDEWKHLDVNVTDRQTGQRSDSIGRTVLQTVAQKCYIICYGTVVCLSVTCVKVTASKLLTG